MNAFRLMGFTVALALACSGAAAGPLNGDVHAMPGWTDSVYFDDFGGLSATVDYAIYAPGQFPYSGYTPTPGEFVYAYQVYATGSVEVNVLALAMLESNEANNIGSFALPGGVTPSSMTLDEYNCQWDFSGMGGLRGANTVSAGLVYSSINEPTWWIGSVGDSGQVDNEIIPSPSNLIPEPATMALLAVAAAGLLRRKR